MVKVGLGWIEHTEKLVVEAKLLIYPEITIAPVAEGLDGFATLPLKS